MAAGCPLDAAGVGGASNGVGGTWAGARGRGGAKGGRLGRGPAGLWGTHAGPGPHATPETSIFLVLLSFSS